MLKTLSKLFGTKYDRDLKKIRPTIARINELEPSIKALRDSELKAKTPEFKERIERGEKLDSLLPEAFAVCREASVRALGMRHYDVQMIGGYSLNSGAINEMKTGEGKTLVATLPMYLNGLTGRGAHLVTVNDYLATRDAEWMGQVYNYLGLSVGTIIHGRNDRERQEAYAADITYGTNNEFGFDYLRDNMKFDLKDYVQREHHFAIVDECDSILIDEARTPLIISGPAEDSVDKYYEVNKIIPHLKRDVHFTMEEKSKTASLTEEGNTKVEELLNIDNLFDPQHIEILHHIYQGLKAHYLYSLDVDYMIKNGEVIIVDEFTGRLMEGRRWSDGLHQAVEAKEKVTVRSENQTLATVTFQNYFRMYEKLSGMTGTAETEAVEFKKIYELDVMVIPTNKPIARLDEDDVVYKNEQGKFNAIVADIIERQKKGQPVLVGTVSIDGSERISRALQKGNITHNVLNAKHHEREAEIVSQAGRYEAVTIATNMAGRGTDIVLGGNPQALAKRESGEEEGEKYQAALKKYEPLCAEEKRKVIEAGGLYIMGTERHESRRIDNQLRGRSGRQGDPGESRFFLSLEDNLMRIFNGERIQRIMETLKVPEDEPIMARMVSRAIEGAQRKVEGHNFDIRKHLLDYDDVMNKQRTAIYDLRRDILGGKELVPIALEFLGEVTSHVLDIHASEQMKPLQWDLEGLQKSILKQFNLNLELPPVEELNTDRLTKVVSEAVKHVFDEQVTALGPHFDEVLKMVFLQTVDMSWKDHLFQIDKLKEGINLRAYAQKDPLIEYKKEAFRMFETVNYAIKAETIEKMIRVQLVDPEAARQRMEQMRSDERDEGSQYEYEGGEDGANSGFFGETFTAPKDPASGSTGPMAQPPQGGGNPFGESQDQGPKLNRAERRRREKLAKKRRG